MKSEVQLWKLQKGSRGCGGVLTVCRKPLYINKTIIITMKKLVIKITQHITFYSPTITCEALSPFSQLSFVGPNAVGLNRAQSLCISLVGCLCDERTSKAIIQGKLAYWYVRNQIICWRNAFQISRWWGTAVTRQWSWCYCYQPPPMEDWGELIIIR